MLGWPSPAFHAVTALRAFRFWSPRTLVTHARLPLPVTRRRFLARTPMASLGPASEDAGPSERQPVRVRPEKKTSPQLN